MRMIFDLLECGQLHVLTSVMTMTVYFNINFAVPAMLFAAKVTGYFGMAYYFS